MNNYTVTINNRPYVVTQEQLDACTRRIDPETRVVHYEVKSATTPGTTYKVYFNRRRGRIACNCPAFDFLTCWHRRAAVLKEDLFKRDLRAQYDAARAAIEESEEYRMEVNQTAALQAKRSYVEALRAKAMKGDEAALREFKALGKYGMKAYDTEDFTIL